MRNAQRVCTVVFFFSRGFFFAAFRGVSENLLFGRYIFTKLRVNLTVRESLEL